MRRPVQWAAPALLAALLGAGAAGAVDLAYLTQQPQAGDALALGLRYLETSRPQLGLTAADLAGAQITSRYQTRHNGVTHIYLRQSHAGVPVVNATLNLNVAPDGRIISLGGRFVPDLAAAVNATAPALDAREAVLAAADHLGLAPAGPLEEIERVAGVAPEHRFAPAGLSLEEIPARLTYRWRQPDAGRDVRLAWEVTLRLLDHQHWWVISVDAADGRILDKSDLIDHDAYRVFRIPIESPNHGPRRAHANAADPVASPRGWHDTDGDPGAEFTDTRGNNAFAQEDRDANNSGGFRPDGGPDLTFSSPLDLETQQPIDYQAAAITNLFYWNNVIHDVWYHYGFDEASGNFQENNYGRGGAQSDPVQADAQDGSGFNNANFSTPADGSDPRMQMFEWQPPQLNLLEVLSGPAEGEYAALGAAFGPPFPDDGLQAPLVLGEDGAGGDPNDACEPLTNGEDLDGRIAVINRGTCTFVSKVRAAQVVGAVGAIIVNNVPGDPLTMGDDGTGGDIVIPSAMISLEDGDLIRPGLPAPARVTDFSADLLNRDSDLDNGVIAHEYGHGVSNRLTGGPADVGCLNNQEQMGEGWSDWHALALTSRPGHTAERRRGVGTYLVFQPIDGTGIRSFPYSTDLAINPHTYDDIKTAAVPHGVGSVWTAMLWEVYWNLVDKYGYDADLYRGNGGNNRAMQLVMDGLKLQPCSPGFIEGRDAVLMADLIATGGANQCEIWRGFAKRGLGVSADGGSPFSVADGTEAFDLPPRCRVALSAPDPGEPGGENCYTVRRAVPDGRVALLVGREIGQVTPPGCSTPISIGDPRIRATGVADGNGTATLCTAIPPGGEGRDIRAQVVDRDAPGCRVSNVDVTRY